MTDPTPPAEGEDPLAALSERLRSAQETADRLVREATRAATMAGADPATDVPGESDSDPGPGPADGASGGRRPPPRGYATPGGEAPRSTAADIQALAALLDLGRTLLPPELRAQIAELIREILLLVRALIDWYLERVEQGRKPSVEVQDIPIS
ncbi:MAG: hypothetical protein QOI91_2740 [Solirubrobacteraceae bacterium]|jgi:hypothetical protein|nr:hypothetical protein [Solirubrobacteraceae bacterium]